MVFPSLVMVLVTTWGVSSGSQSSPANANFTVNGNVNV